MHPAAPKDSATRRIVPTFPGSCNRARTTISGIAAADDVGQVVLPRSNKGNHALGCFRALDGLEDCRIDFIHRYRRGNLGYGCIAAPENTNDGEAAPLCLFKKLGAFNREQSLPCEGALVQGFADVDELRVVLA